MFTRHPTRYFGLRDSVWTRCFEPSRSDWCLLREMKSYAKTIDGAPDHSLANLISQLKLRVGSGESVLERSIVVQTLAIASQAIRRTLGISAYDVQILSGIAMVHGAIAEMKTGEGKTLASVFPIVAHALSGCGVHVATVNSYLANRDFETLSAPLQRLGLSVGISRDGASVDEKRLAYACDVTFATGYELGFDFLRDQISLRSRGPDRLGEKLRRQMFAQENLSKPPAQRLLTQRGHAVAIIDEIDSVLIDEATTPLVLSGGDRRLPKNNAAVYQLAQKSALKLDAEADFVIDETTKSLFLTHRGVEHSKLSSTKPIGLQRPWKNYIESALRAQHLMVRDVNYVVRNEKIEIVDEFTGRIFGDRNWRDGLHQAVETREQVPISEERRTVARISRQQYFQRYDLICGMTGTAVGHQAEMLSCYRIPIVVIPLRKASQRIELRSVYFANETQKMVAIVADVAVRNKTKQPVLIGTRTIEQSLRLSKQLKDAGVDHQVLNGIQDGEESDLIAMAGQMGAVTVATNLAGRGTDIQLDPLIRESVGLHVIGFERNFSQRIDRQLLGRAGRQGDPGSGQFFVSSTDELVRRYGVTLSKTLSRLTEKNGGQPNAQFDQRIARMQATAEKESGATRRDVMREELWLSKVKKAAG